MNYVTKGKTIETSVNASALVNRITVRARRNERKAHNCSFMPIAACVLSKEAFGC